MIAFASMVGLPFRQGKFTPTFTFATPGNLSTSYAVQDGTYVKIGCLVFVSILVSVTPTHTTASGNARIGGLPFPVEPVNNYVLPTDIVSTVTWPTGTTQVVGIAIAGQSYIEFRSEGSGVSRTAWAGTQFPTGTLRNVQFTGCYVAAA